MVSDTYSDVSGSIDALIWIIFGPLLWGTVFWLIYRAVKKRKMQDENTPRTNANNTFIKSELNTNISLLAPINKDWDTPRYSSGYLRNAGWYADPSGKFKKRYFNGKEWTDEVLSTNSPREDNTTNALSRNTVSQMQDWRLPLNADGSLKSSGYYWDPSGRFKKRYFDGKSWTQNVLPRKDSPDIQLTTDGSSINQSDNTSLNKNTIPNNVDSSEFAIFKARDTGISDTETIPTNVAQDLQTLADLYERGLLSNQQYEAAKNQILNQGDL